MRFITSAIAVLCCSTSLVRGSVLKRASTKETQTQFDQETTSFVSQGLCRFYTDGKHDPKELCYTYCKQKTNVTCESAGSAGDTYLDPSGAPFEMGKCTCSAPAIASAIAEIVLKAMPMVAGIACTEMFDAFKLVVNSAIDFVPEGKDLTDGMKKGIEGAKTMATNAQSADDFFGWSKNVCNPGNNPEVAALNSQVDDLYGKLQKIPDAIAAGAGCVRGDPAECVDLATQGVDAATSAADANKAKATSAPASSAAKTTSASAAAKTSSSAPKSTTKGAASGSKTSAKTSAAAKTTTSVAKPTPTHK